jgi:glycosyltransferase involved in cell wall biosynthesis
MANRYLFSVIIPTYNRAERLDVALKSLVNQHFKDFEVIIADDGSTDHTRDIVAKYYSQLNIKFITEDNWGGPGRPRNNGIDVAEGEWLCFLDSDDSCVPEKLQSVLPYLKDHDFIYHDLSVFDENGDTGRIKKCRKLAADPCLDLIVNRNGICNSGVIVKTDLVLKAGGFSEDKNLIAIEDYDLWIRIAQYSNRFFYLPLPLGNYFVGGNNISSNYLRRNKIEKLVFNKYEHLIPKDLISKATVNLNISLTINYIMANNISYIASLYKVFIKGSLRNKAWASFNLFLGPVYLKWRVRQQSLDS